MKITEQDLQEEFRLKNADDLIDILAAGSGGYTVAALCFAAKELRARGIDPDAARKTRAQECAAERVASHLRISGATFGPSRASIPLRLDWMLPVARSLGIHLGGFALALVIGTSAGHLVPGPNGGIGILLIALEVGVLLVVLVSVVGLLLFRKTRRLAGLVALIEVGLSVGFAYGVLRDWWAVWLILLITGSAVGAGISSLLGK